MKEKKNRWFWKKKSTHTRNFRCNHSPTFDHLPLTLLFVIQPCPSSLRNFLSSCPFKSLSSFFVRSIQISSIQSSRFNYNVISQICKALFKRPFFSNFALEWRRGSKYPIRHYRECNWPWTGKDNLLISNNDGQWWIISQSRIWRIPRAFLVKRCLQELRRLTGDNPAPLLLWADDKTTLRMTKRCSWGTSNVDTQYPERCEGITFIPFVTSNKHWNKATSLRLIRACGRPHHQLNPKRVNTERVARYICSKIWFDQ